jgi:hypothetical protein
MANPAFDVTKITDNEIKIESYRLTFTKITDNEIKIESYRLTFTANVKPLTKFLILQLYYNSFYTSFEIYQSIIKLVVFNNNSRKQINHSSHIHQSSKLRFSI